MPGETAPTSLWTWPWNVVEGWVHGVTQGFQPTRRKRFSFLLSFHRVAGEWKTWWVWFLSLIMTADSHGGYENRISAVKEGGCHSFNNVEKKGKTDLQSLGNRMYENTKCSWFQPYIQIMNQLGFIRNFLWANFSVKCFAHSEEVWRNKWQITYNG